MGWFVVPCLLEGRDQMDRRFPHRDRRSDGTIGDLSHQKRVSSHNPDITGTPEFRDHDELDEVRAIDFDKDLNDAASVTMEQVVQLWVTRARAGKMPFLRYLIYNKRIWHRADGFKTRVYTGSNQHTDHAHANSDFSNFADGVRGTNWFLDDLGRPVPKPPAPHRDRVVKKGDKGSDVVNIQTFLRDVFPAYRHAVGVRHGVPLVADGVFGDQTEAWVKEFQRRTGIVHDGIVGPQTFATMRRYGYKH